MSELQPIDYLRVDEIDRAHAAASYINRALFSDEEVAFRDAIQMTQEVILELTPVQQAENTLMRKTAEDTAVAEVTPMLKEVYDLNPSKAKAMTTEEFAVLAEEYIAVCENYRSLKTTRDAIAGTANHFYESGQLSGYADEKGSTWSFESVMNVAGISLWAGDYAYSTLAMAKKDYAAYVFKAGMQTYTDETYDYNQHYDEYRDIENAKDDVSHWLREARKMADREVMLAEINMNQYIMQHADPTTKAYQDAKHTMQRRLFDETTWDEYMAGVRQWCESYGVELDEPPAYTWNIGDEVLWAPDVEAAPATRVLDFNEACNIEHLEGKLNDFHPKSVDALVAEYLINEGHADQVVENFHVFTGNTARAACLLLEQKGVGYTLDSLHRLHGLNSLFLRTLLDEWDKAWDKASVEGDKRDAAGERGYPWEWPAGLYYPTDKMGRIIANLDSFAENSLDARLPFELVTRMGADRDHGGDSMRLVRMLMGKVDRFKPFDHLEFAKHYAKEVRVPHHWSWHEMLAPVMNALDLPDTPEARKFAQEVEEAYNADDDEYEASDA